MPINNPSPPDVTQTDPTLLKHLPHGYYATGLSYLPLAVDSAGTLLITSQSNVITITFIIDGAGTVIAAGQKGHLEIPFAYTITGWTILADVSGSIVIDVWKDTYANFPPTVADTITGTEKPTISAAQKGQDLTLTTWITAIAAGDILAFNVDSCTTITRVVLTLRGTKT